MITSIKEILHEKVNQLTDAQAAGVLVYLQQLGKEPLDISKGNPIGKFTDFISDEDAKELTDIVNREFNTIEGEW